MNFILFKLCVWLVIILAICLISGVFISLQYLLDSFGGLPFIMLAVICFIWSNMKECITWLERVFNKNL